MSDLDIATLQGMISAAKMKKDESQAVVDNFNGTNQAKIDAARAEIETLNSDIASYQTQVDDYQAQIDDPPMITKKDKDGKNEKDKKVVDKAALEQLQTDKQATEEMLAEAQAEVQAAQAEIDMAQQAISAGLDVSNPGYAEAMKMFSVLSHIDKLIALRASGADVADSELDSLNNKITQAADLTQDMMGSEFVTKFWEDVEAGLIVLKETDPNAVSDARAAVDAFFDAAVADENSTERDQLYDLNELLINTMVNNTLGEVLGDTSATFTPQSLPDLLGGIADIFNDNGIPGSTDPAEQFTGFTGELVILLDDAGFDTTDLSQELSVEAFEFLVNEINDFVEQGLLLSEDAMQAGRDNRTELEARLDGASDADKVKIQEALSIISTYNKGSAPIFINDVPDMITDLSAKNSQELTDLQTMIASMDAEFTATPTTERAAALKEKRSDLILKIHEDNFWSIAQDSTVVDSLSDEKAQELKEILVDMEDSTDHGDDYKLLLKRAVGILYPNELSESSVLNPAEEINSTLLKQNLYASQEFALKGMRDDWTVVATGPGAQFLQGAFESVDKEIAKSNQLQTFWSQRQTFWINFSNEVGAITDEGTLSRLETYGNQIKDLEGQYESLANDNNVDTGAIDQTMASLNDYETRIQNIFDTGFEGHVGPPETKPLYDYVFNALLPENISTEGPKISAMNQLLASRLIETALGGSEGQSVASLLSDIADIYGDNADAQMNYSGFTGDLQNYLEFKFYDTQNASTELSTEALVEVIDTINNFSNGNTYLETADSDQLTATMTKLDDVKTILNARKQEITTGQTAAGDPIDTPQTLPGLLGEIATALGDSGVPGSVEQNEQFTGLTGAIAKSLSNFDIYNTEAALTLSEVYTVLDNIRQIEVLFDYLNVNDTSSNAERSLSVYYAANDYVDITRQDIDMYAEGVEDLQARIDAVKDGSSDESLEALIVEKNQFSIAKQFAEATEEFWTYEVAFSYPPSQEEDVQSLHMQIGLAEEDFYATILNGSYDATKMQDLSTLKNDLAVLRGVSFNYQAIIPNINMAEQAIFSNVKYETLDQDSVSLQQELDDLNSGNTNLSPAQVQRRKDEIRLGKSIIDFQRDFWITENAFNQNLLKLSFPESKTDELNLLLNKLSDLQREIEHLMTQLSSNTQAGRVAKSQITRKRTQIGSLKNQIIGLSN